MPVVRPLALALPLALAATALAVGIGVAVRDVPEDDTETVAPSVPLTDFDTTGLVAERAAFCDRVPAEAVTEALGAEPANQAAYGNGDRAELVDRVRDVSHEFSCAWSAADGTVARAWVFVPPVTPATADDLVADARRTKGCRADAAAPAYGVPSVALLCQQDGTRQQSYRGLFGDAWLTCQLTAPAAVAASVLQDRAGRWCVAVAQATERG